MSRSKMLSLEHLEPMAAWRDVAWPNGSKRFAVPFTKFQSHVWVLVPLRQSGEEPMLDFNSNTFAIILSI